jgi:CubicO group peptidase (beta-lactamase class C family)
MFSSLVLNGRAASSQTAGPVVPWWSFTKTVLAATALTLVRDGLLALDDRVAEGPFTLRQLLRHEAGLADYGELADYHAAVADHQRPWSEAEMLRRLDAERLRYPPGEGWGYSNVGFLYVSQLIERLTGLGIEQALTQRVLAPLGLTGIRMAKVPADLQGVWLGSEQTYDPGWVYHGLLVGTLDNAALLLDGLLCGAILPPSLLQEMLSVRALGGPMAGRPWLTPGYALGLMRGGVEHGLILSGHTGVGPGSVVAVYRGANGETTATCAVFNEGADQGRVEAELVRQLTAALGVSQP